MDTNTAIWIGYIAGALTFGWLLPWIGEKLKAKSGASADRRTKISKTEQPNKIGTKTESKTEEKISDALSDEAAASKNFKNDITVAFEQKRAYRVETTQTGLSEAGKFATGLQPRCNQDRRRYGA